MSSSNWDDDDEAFTEEQLLAIDAIEASYNLSHSPSSSATPTVLRSTTSGHVHEVPDQIPSIRRQLPCSITSPTASTRFPLSRCGGDFTEEELLAIDAIEASYNFSHSSSSSATTPTVLRSTTSGHIHEAPSEIPSIRRQLPRSITSPTASTRFPLSRCGDKNFPAMKFGGRIVYSKTSNEVDKRAMQLLKALETKRDETGRAIVGLDIEWRPSFRKGVLPGKVATVQICVDNNYCDVMHIFHSGIPQRLQHLIEDSTLVKVGIGIDGDSVKLFHDYGVSIKGVEDLSDLANQKLGGNSKKWGLASLTETLVSKKLLKPNGIRLGNWEARPLSKKQLQYAATDAYTSWHLYQVLKDLPDAESFS